jgi:hypothetical protein
MKDFNILAVDNDHHNGDIILLHLKCGLIISSRILKKLEMVMEMGNRGGDESSIQQEPWMRLEVKRD